MRLQRMENRLAKLKRIKPIDAKHEKWLAKTILQVEKEIAKSRKPTTVKAVPQPPVKTMAPPPPKPKQIDWAKLKEAAAKL